MQVLMRKRGSSESKNFHDLLKVFVDPQLLCSLFFPVKLIKNNQDSPAAGAKLEAGGGAEKFAGGAAEPAAVKGFSFWFS